MTTEPLPEQTVRHIGAQRRSGRSRAASAYFYASGDLTARKLIPAFYHLCKEKLTPAFRLIGLCPPGKIR